MLEKNLWVTVMIQFRIKGHRGLSGCIIDTLEPGTQDL